jgi:hypothetical protein
VQQIFEGEFFALYSQIALIDAEDPDSYPQWETGEENAILGPKGVVVATQGDIKVGVVVYNGLGNPGGILCSSGEILVGEQGLFVGNEVASDTAPLEWTSGKTAVMVYVDKLYQAKQVSFLLENLKNDRSRIK